jgi:hypothetical protein
MSLQATPEGVTDSAARIKDAANSSFLRHCSDRRSVGVLTMRCSAYEGCQYWSGRYLVFSFPGFSFALSLTRRARTSLL